MRKLAACILAFVALAGCKGLGHKKKSQPEPIAVFTESFVSPHKLVTAHFPTGFHTSLGGKNGIVLGRDLDDGSDEAISILCIADPISQDSAEFAKVVLPASTAKLNNYKQLSQRVTTCNGVEGATEVTGTWTDKESGRQLFRRACAFTRHQHGYAFGYSIPQGYAAEHMPLFQAIVDGTQFND